ncbi:MAG: hypothetical protein ACHWZW_07980 [Spirulina sp.]
MNPNSTPQDSTPQGQSVSPNSTSEGAKWALERLLSAMPQEVATSFSEEQRLALQTALVANTRKRHPVDVRWSIPILRRQFYLVFLMGEEVRSKAGRQARSR